MANERVSRSCAHRERSNLCSAWARDERGVALCCILVKNHEGLHQWAPDTSEDSHEPYLGVRDGIVPERFRSRTRPKITSDPKGNSTK